MRNLDPLGERLILLSPQCQVDPYQVFPVEEPEFRCHYGAVGKEHDPEGRDGRGEVRGKKYVETSLGLEEMKKKRHRSCKEQGKREHEGELRHILELLDAEDMVE